MDNAEDSVRVLGSCDRGRSMDQRGCAADEQREVRSVGRLSVLMLVVCALAVSCGVSGRFSNQPDIAGHSDEADGDWSVGVECRDGVVDAEGVQDSSDEHRPDVESDHLGQVESTDLQAESVGEEHHCDDHNDCTLDRCGGLVCVHEAVLLEGCCATATDCDDGDACTYELCLGYRCQYAERLQPCCSDDSECESHSPCETVWCEGGKCRNEWMSPQEQSNAGLACCSSHEDCGVGGLWEEDSDHDGQPGPDDASTVDYCEHGICRHTKSPGECQCGPEAGMGCPQSTTWCAANECYMDCVCVAVPTKWRCYSDFDCTDGDACTKDRCIDGCCKFEERESCCVSSDGCGDPLHPSDSYICVEALCFRWHNPDSIFCEYDWDCADCDPSTETRCGDSGLCEWAEISRSPQ